MRNRSVFKTSQILLLLATIFSVSAYGQQTARIGFVDPVRLIEQAPQGARALKALENEFRARDEELKQLNARIQEMEADLEIGRAHV